MFRESIGGFRAYFASQMGQFGASERVLRVIEGFKSAFRESIGSVRGFRAHFASQLVQFGASERVSRVNWFSSGLQSAFRESIGFSSGLQSVFRESLRASERVSRVNWFSSGLQSASRVLIGSVRCFRARVASQLVQFRGFRARFASQLVYNLVQFGASERVSRVNWFSSGLQTAERKSFELNSGLQSAERKSFD